MSYKLAKYPVNMPDILTKNHEKMKTYIFKLSHDKGTFKLKTYARDQEQAINSVMESEGCPRCAIKLLKEFETMYKVMKIFRVSRRREVIKRGLTEDQAQRLVNSYPDSSRSMVIYTKQFKNQ
jgi:hypothetical protein